MNIKFNDYAFREISGRQEQTLKAAVTVCTVMVLIAAYLIAAAVLLPQSEVYAENKKFEEKCEFDGNSINSDFNSDKFASTIKNMEPGDSLTYRITYKNASDKVTLWYMKTTVLETLEENKDQAENGGYTYKLSNDGPDGEQVYFDNSEVGGEKVVDKLQGLKQATNATQNYFFIQELDPGEHGVTKLYVEFDGETEVNDYMDTQGALLIKYAVQNQGETSGKPGSDPVDDPNDPDYEEPGEPDKPGHKHKDPKVTNGITTGDRNRIMYYVTLLSISTVLLIAAVLIWWRSLKKEEKTGKAGEQHEE